MDRFKLKYLVYKFLYILVPNDALFLEVKYWLKTGHKLNLKKPIGFCEKLQWLKLHDRKPVYTIMVDKYAVKEYVGKIIGQDHIIPTLGVWDKFKDIDFEKLPSQFVLKCTHDSGGLIIVKDKTKLDIDKASRVISWCLKKNFYYEGREFQYKNVPPKIIAERYIEQEDGSEIKDYKVLCFGGKAKLIEVHSDRHSNHHTQEIYDTEWNLTTYAQGKYTFDKVIDIPKPSCLNEMLKFSEQLTQNMPTGRVDWYVVNGHLYFGEITLYDGSGYELFNDPKIEHMLGDWICLINK